MTSSKGAKVIAGPTYDEMLNPGLLPAEVRAAALAARQDELNPLNLFNITWMDPQDRPRYVVLPKEFTRTKANIVVMLGYQFPSGSHKVGPAYSTLAENEVTGRIKPGNVMVGPSTGNFGIGVAYISKLKGYEALVVMPEGMSAERYERIKKYGGKLDLTPGSESDVILVLERVEEIKRDPNNFVLAQFELLPNYRFHRHVTGNSCLKAAANVGNGKVAAFVSAPGSAGTLAAGDAIKHKFPSSSIVALEPKECSTLFDAGMGTHRIEGIGDKMVVLIHNVRNTDYVMLIHDDDTVKALKLMNSGAHLLKDTCKSPEFECYPPIFGISSMCNIIGAIRTAHQLNLGENENVVTIATDGFDRYPSVMEDLERRVGPVDDHVLSAWYEEIFCKIPCGELLDVRPQDQQNRLFRQKEETWLRFNYTKKYLDSMKSQDFWEHEYSKVGEMNKAIAEFRETNGVWPPPLG